MCLNYYGLDPAYYITLPNYSWNAFLSLTGVRLQQIHIKELYEMIEHGLRGGMTQCSFKKVEAKNKYMNAYYDKSKPSSYISYLDANNLYGAMCKKLPSDDFKWHYGRMDEQRVMKYSDDDDIGCILEVDLDYPKEGALWPFGHKLKSDCNNTCTEAIVKPQPCNTWSALDGMWLSTGTMMPTSL